MDFPIKNGGSFHSYVKLPEGNVLFIFFSTDSPIFSPWRLKKMTSPTTFMTLISTKQLESHQGLKPTMAGYVWRMRVDGWCVRLTCLINLQDCFLSLAIFWSMFFGHLVAFNNGELEWWVFSCNCSTICSPFKKVFDVIWRQFAAICGIKKAEIWEPAPWQVNTLSTVCFWNRPFLPPWAALLPRATDVVGTEVHQLEEVSLSYTYIYILVVYCENECTDVHHLHNQYTIYIYNWLTIYTWS